MLKRATLLGAVLLAVGLVGCQGTDYTENTAMFKEHIGQRLDRVAKTLDRLERTRKTSGKVYASFVDRVQQELTRTRHEIAQLGRLGKERYARLRRKILRDTDDLEYRLDRVGS